MDFLQLSGKSILVFGVANRKSVAWHIGRVLCEAGAKCVYVVQNEEVRKSVEKLLGAGVDLHVCDVEHDEQIARLHDELAGAVRSFTAWSIRWPSPTTPTARARSTRPRNGRSSRRWIFRASR